MKAPLRSFLIFVAGWTVVCIGLFLLLSGFLSTWSGQAVSVRSVGTPEEPLPIYTVLVAQEDGTRFEGTWPAEALTGLDLAIDRRALPPKPLPEGLPKTSKDRFTLSFALTPEGGATRWISTATPQTFALAILALVGGLLLRNMAVAGNPLSLEPRGVELVKGQAAPGTIARKTYSKEGRAQRRGGKKGPPPGKKRRGGGRRK